MLYLELFHGRKTLDEQMNDWGEQGPVFGPFPYFHTTYACDIKFGEEGHLLRILQPDGLVYYDGMYYGDWSVFPAQTFEGEAALRERHSVFEQVKACPPQIEATQADVQQTELDALGHQIALVDCASVLKGEALIESDDGVEWWNLGEDVLDPEVTELAMRYLTLRGVLARHPVHPNWIRIAAEPNRADSSEP